MTNKQMNVSVDPKVYQEARIKAIREGRPLAEVIREKLREYLKEPAKANSK